MRRRSAAALAEPRPRGSVPRHAREVVSSGGVPLEPELRAAFEADFGHDFGSVRIHDDARASASATKLNARAYTIGSDIVLRSRERDPSLLAHELTHVVQQTTGAMPAGVQRQPWSHRTDFKFDRGLIRSDDLLDDYVMARLHSMSRPELRAYRSVVDDPAVIAYIDMLLMAPPTEKIETGRFLLNKQNVDAAAKADYWFQRTFRAYTISVETDRLSKSDEEKDAVYAALWNVRPEPNNAGGNELVSIPATPQRKSQLLYRFRFSPPPAAGAKPGVAIEFVTAQAGDVTTTMADVPKNENPPDVTFDVEMIDDPHYFRKHPEVKRQINAFMARQTGEFEQVVVTKAEQRNAPPRDVLFLVSGKRKPKGGFENTGISLLADPKVNTASLPPDYHSRDYADLLLEALQTTPHAKLKDKLGYVNVDGVPADEVLSVKYTIAMYFDKMETRNAEVDAVVPIANTQREVFYTLRFRKDNEVDVERVGEKGSSEKLDPDRLDLARVRGYAEHATDPAKLRTWLGKRYRGLKPTGSTVDDLRKSVNAEMASRASTPDWFKQNYTMFVLDGAATLQRLRTAHRETVAATPAADKKDWSGDELKIAELSLQTLTDTIIQKLAAVRLGRKAVARDKRGTVTTTIGNAFTSGANNTVVLYDGAFHGPADVIFRGGAEGVNRAETMELTHEFAHILEFNKVGLREAFLKFTKRMGVVPFTAYAASQPDKDFFTEAFGIYQTDPEWMRRNHTSVYSWIDEYARTGKIPK